MLGEFHDQLSDYQPSQHTAS